MSRRAPHGGPAPEWPNEPGDGYGGAEYGPPARSEYGQPGQYGQVNGQANQPTQTFSYPNGGPGRQGPAEPQGYPQGRGPQPPAGPRGYPPGRGPQGRAPQRPADPRGYEQGRGPQRPGDTRGYEQGRGPQRPGPGDTRRYQQGSGDGRYQQGNGDGRQHRDGPAQGNMRRYEDPRPFNEQGRQAQGPGQRRPTGGPGPGRAPGPASGGPGGPRRPGRPGRKGQGGPGRKVRFRRIRRLMRYRTARAISAVLALLLVWGTFSLGQATFANNGQSAIANFAEWFRSHHMNALVTLGEYLTYTPPKVGGKPSFSLSVPKGEAVTPVKPAKTKNAFVPDIPAPLKALAGPPLTGEGQWRVVDKVDGQPAIFTTFLRDATYTSYVNGIASIDPRLVQFQLHPGSQDPGAGNWGPWGSNYIPPGARTGLVATFNSGFKLDSAGGGFYLNGQYHGSLVNGAASVVYYKNGTIKVGSWGSEVSMTPQVEAVRQNLKLLIDHGKLAPNLNQNIESSWGATLGGGYYVWRSGLGITKSGRVVYVYGPELNVQDLAGLLKSAGAVEGMQLDINPYWMKFEYYTAGKTPSNPTPTNLLPTQQQSAYTYYSPYTRDFTAVYARSKPYVK